MRPGLYRLRQPLKREAGRIEMRDNESGKTLQTIPLAQCVHCGQQFPISPGSGRIRGFCFRCNGAVCGPSCIECVPVEKYLESIEGTVDLSAGKVAQSVIWTP